ncbi:DUF4156 domain-containing protein [Saccharophagus degradans]|uniref:DUF4156 domain-containing protein n=1 Tax=Saccharophagus degradans TaxID=86304 RepID=UPI002477F783|nr:DUF4156 domain-containing protein [Saccharophagus degradans]WGP00404.1 DUF4156 domain-containing protein [Saccharophagus degradans]
MKGAKIIVVGSVVALCACSWVKPISGAEQVSLIKPGIAQACKELGSASAQVKDRVGIFGRNEKKIADELVALAKNEAVRMGGDAVVAQGAPKDGFQKFNVYLCEK